MKPPAPVTSVRVSLLPAISTPFSLGSSADACSKHRFEALDGRILGQLALRKGTSRPAELAGPLSVRTERAYLLQQALWISGLDDYTAACRLDLAGDLVSGRDRCDGRYTRQKVGGQLRRHRHVPHRLTLVQEQRVGRAENVGELVSGCEWKKVDVSEHSLLGDRLQHLLLISVSLKDEAESLVVARQVGRVEHTLEALLVAHAACVQDDEVVRPPSEALAHRFARLRRSAQAGRIAHAMYPRSRHAGADEIVPEPVGNDADAVRSLGQPDLDSLHETRDAFRAGDAALLCGATKKVLEQQRVGHAIPRRGKAREHCAAETRHDSENDAGPPGRHKAP